MLLEISLMLILCGCKDRLAAVGRNAMVKEQRVRNKRNNEVLKKRKDHRKIIPNEMSSDLQTLGRHDNENHGAIFTTNQ